MARSERGDVLAIEHLGARAPQLKFSFDREIVAEALVTFAYRPTSDVNDMRVSLACVSALSGFPEGWQKLRILAVDHRLPELVRRRAERVIDDQ